MTERTNDTANATRTAPGRWEDLRAGDALGPLRYTVSEQAVADFCAATGIPGAAYRRLAAWRDAVPPTLTATDYTALLRGRLRPFVGMHARQSLRLYRPLPVAAPVVASGAIAETYVRRGRNYLAVEYTVADESGAPYSSSRITMTIDGYTDVTADDAPIAAHSRKQAAASATARLDARALAGVAAPVRAGQQWITQEAMTRFAGQPGLRFAGMPAVPRNHHTEPELARQMGLRGTVAQSLQYCALAAQLALEQFGAAFLARGQMSFLFLQPVYSGDLLTITLGETAERGDCYDVRCLNQQAQLVAIGSAALVDADARL